MLVVTAFHNGDAELAAGMFAWCAELDGKQSHSCVLVASKGMSEDKVRLVRDAAAGAFNVIALVRPKEFNEKGWPESPNLLFKTACAYVSSAVRQPFLWLEPDAVPLKPGWLVALSNAYVTSGKPYLGTIRDIPINHITGVAVYPSEVARYNARSLNPGRNNFGPIPFDLAAADRTLKFAATTPLIQHEWGSKDQPPKFETLADLDKLSDEAMLFHRVKSGRLIELLREKRSPKPLLNRIVSAALEKLSIPTSTKPKIDLLYICVRSPSEPGVPRNFRESHERFVRTYKQFKPGIPHRLVVVCYNGERDSETESLFAGLNPVYTYYTGGGFDIGTYLTVGRGLDSEFVLLCGSNVHFWRTGWLERMYAAFKKHGEGVYGPMASYETSPHIRTCCLGTTPGLLRQYPHDINTRLESYKFESGEWNFTKWVQDQGKPALMVLEDDELEQPRWRTPPNIFRRGDQSNCIIWDRHTLVFARSKDVDRDFLSKMADGGEGAAPFPLLGTNKSYESITVCSFTSLNTPGHAKAIEWTADLIPHKCEKLLIAPKPVPGFSGKQLPLPEPWARNGKWSLDDMCSFLLFGLHKYIETDVMVMVHDDGYALHRSKWSDDFLYYDYIGAPWPLKFSWVKPDCRVGNGGFSLRSKNWLQRASRLPPIPPKTSEDTYTSIKYLQHFVNTGCRIAPKEVAARWSYEHPIEEFPNWKITDSFGFHGRVGELPERKHMKLK
jgi:hypothetical protein